MHHKQQPTTRREWIGVAITGLLLAIGLVAYYFMFMRARRPPPRPNP